MVQSVVQIPYNEHNAISQNIREALEAAGLDPNAHGVASWLDVLIEGVGLALDSKRCGAVVPCRSLWNAAGMRLAAVLVFESLF